jgi:hypothetical protein
MSGAQKTVARDLSHEFGDEASNGEPVVEQDRMLAYNAAERQSHRAVPRASSASGRWGEWADVEADASSEEGDEDKFSNTWSSPVFSSPRSCSPCTAPEAAGGGLDHAGGGLDQAVLQESCLPAGGGLIGAIVRHVAIGELRTKMAEHGGGWTQPMPAQKVEPVTGLHHKIDRIREVLQIQLTAATIVAAANVTMGMPGTGTLPEQADALLAALGEL